MLINKDFCSLPSPGGLMDFLFYQAASLVLRVILGQHLPIRSPKNTAPKYYYIPTYEEIS